jgi:hypothetical protein
MDGRLQNAIAKIEIKRDGQVANRGTGALIGTNRVITALHVVGDRAAALSLTPQMGTQPLPAHDGEIWLTFPNHLPLQARILDSQWDARQDWALLESVTPVPSEIAPLSLAAIDRDGQHWESYGFPDAKADGLAVGGTVRSARGHVAGEPAYQLYCIEAAAGDGMPIKGLSGAPVLIAGHVVGILRWAVLQHESKNVGGTVYACPADRFAGACGYAEPLVNVEGSEPAGAAAGAAPASGRGWWRPAAVVLLAAAAALTIWLAVRPPEGRNSQPPDPPPDPNALSFQVIVDRSSGMNQQFGDRTKLEAVKQALSTVFLEKTSDRDNLALREFGGDCNDPGNTRLVLPFAPSEKRLADGVTDLTATAGVSTLVNAVIEATGDFNRQQGARAKSGLIIITSGIARCGAADPEALIRNRLESYPELSFDVRLIGVGASRQDQSALRRVATAAGGTFRNATTPDQLNEEVRQARVIQTKVAEVDQASNALNDCLDHLNLAIQTHLLKERDYDAAGRELAAAEATLQRTQIPASDPSLPQGVRELLEVAREARDDQQNLVRAAAAFMAANKAGDASAQADAQNAYNESRAAFNKRSQEINRRQKALLAASTLSSQVPDADGNAPQPR